jgi:hypothetical protein
MKIEILAMPAVMKAALLPDADAKKVAKTVVV